jgi:NhaP-type Na+/H+ or K+/H+ antiporter
VTGSAVPEAGIVLGLLAAVAFLAAVGRRVGIPDPIVFALGGLALALVPGVPQIALPPSLVLVIFLPPLIFAAAQDTSWAEMRQEARPILLLAVALVLVTMVAVAAVARALAPELTWAAALTLGAIVAPPDTVAAKAIADTLHLPRRMVAILDLGAASEIERADDATLHRATHHLLERLMDVERAELQLLRNTTAIDGLVARRLQRDLDELRLRDRM